MEKRIMFSTRGGFTLVEVSVVLVLVALLSGTAALMVRQPLSQARRQSAISQLRQLDAMARERSRQGRRVRLTFDLKGRQAELIDGRGQSIGQPLILERNQRFHRLLGASKNADQTFSIEFDRWGACRTYAVQVGAKESEWLLVLGTTGQTYLREGSDEIQTIIARERNHTP